MQRANTGYTPITHKVKLVYKKNDGYVRADGAYYQVFAPQDIRKSIGKAVKKLIRDFEGLKAFWDTIHPIREFYFVVNDKYYGSFPTIEKDMEAIKQKYALDRCELFLAKDLENVLFSLPDDIIMSIAGFVPELDAVSESERFSLAFKTIDATTQLNIVPRIYTGKQILRILENVFGYDFDADGVETENEVELSANFLNKLQDLGDLLSNFTPGDRVQLAFELDADIANLENNNLRVFGEQQVRDIQGGEEPFKVPIATIRVVRSWDIPEEFDILIEKWDELMKQINMATPQDREELIESYFEEWDELVEKTGMFKEKENSSTSN
jgi:hypothetical protein